MNETAHTFRKGDNSLRDRVGEYLKTLKNLDNARVATFWANDKEWGETLGDEKDILEAKKILKRSLVRATSRIERKELKEAIEQDLMSEEQAQEFSQLKEKQKLEKNLKLKRKSQSPKRGRKL